MEQRIKDVFSVSLLVFFLAVTVYGMHALSDGDRSTFATLTAVVGLIGVILSLVVAVVLILGND